MPQVEDGLPGLESALKDPDLLNAEASKQRAHLLEQAGVLEAGIEAAQQLKAGNAVEKMLCHQMAASHRRALALMAESEEATDPQMACLKAKTAGRLLDCFARAAVVLQRLQTGAGQGTGPKRANKRSGGDRTGPARLVFHAQPHAPSPNCLGANAPLRSQVPIRPAVPERRHARQEAVPNARRKVTRGTREARPAKQVCNRATQSRPDIVEEPVQYCRSLGASRLEQRVRQRQREHRRHIIRAEGYSARETGPKRLQTRMDTGFAGCF